MTTVQSSTTGLNTSRKVRRNLLDFVAIFAGLLVLLLLVAALSWQFWHSGRIFSGVTIDGIPVGGLTRIEAAARLDAAVPYEEDVPVVLIHEQLRLPLATEALTVERHFTDSINQAYLLGREGPFSTRVAQQLKLMLSGYDLAPEAVFDRSMLRQALSDAAIQMRRTPEPGIPGTALDIDATLASAESQIERFDGEGFVDVPAQMVMLSYVPPVATVAKALTEGLGQSTMPLLLSNERFGLETALDPGQVDSIIYSTEPLRLDRDVLYGFVKQLADQFNIEPRDARLRFNPTTGGLTVLRSSQSGRTLDVDETMANIEAALTNGQETALLVVNEKLPAVDSSRLAEMGIRELVASGTSYFAGSSAARVRNIEVAAEKFDGVVIPPGEAFSFNEYVEDVTGANGFEDSLIIWGDRTAVGVGGGVCQVSTTIFRAAYAGGLPIVERYNHGYVVDWYGEPGMDATIYTPTVDFRFRNDTGAYLLVEPVVESVAGVMTFNLYGTRPDREVTIGERVVTELQEPEDPSYQIDESLVLGEIEQVEWPKEGMTVQVERTIVEDGTTRTDKITSYYQPWRAVYLVGPGTEIPDIFQN